MSYLFDGVNDRIDGTSPVTADTPLTVFCWLKPTRITADEVLVAIADAIGTLNQEVWLGCNGSAGGDPIQAATRTTTNSIASSTAGFVADTWQSACAVFASATDRRAFLNGANKGTNSTNRDITAVLDGIRVGARSDGGAWFSGRIAEVAVWNIALSDADVASLAGGAVPSSIQAANLVGYWPLLSDTNDDAGSNHLTANGAVQDADHPTIGGGGTTVERSASVSATGSIATVGQSFSVSERSAAASATAAIATAGQRDLLRQAAVAAIGAIASAPQRDLLRQVAVSATGAISTAGVRIVERSATVTATAAVQTAPQRDVQRQADLSATGTVTTSGEIEGQIPAHERSAAISASGAVSAAGARVVSRAAAISATGTVSATGQRELLRAVQFAATTSVQAAGLREVSRTAALSATGNVTAAGIFWSTLERSASLAATATVEASGAIVLFEPDTNPITLAYTEPGAVSYTEPAAIVHREHGDTLAHRE